MSVYQSPVGYGTHARLAAQRAYVADLETRNRREDEAELAMARDHLNALEEMARELDLALAARRDPDVSPERIERIALDVDNLHQALSRLEERVRRLSDPDGAPTYVLAWSAAAVERAKALEQRVEKLERRTGGPVAWLVDKPLDPTTEMLERVKDSMSMADYSGPENADIPMSDDDREHVVLTAVRAAISETLMRYIPNSMKLGLDYLVAQEAIAAYRAVTEWSRP